MEIVLRGSSSVGGLLINNYCGLMLLWTNFTLTFNFSLSYLLCKSSFSFSLLQNSCHVTFQIPRIISLLPDCLMLHVSNCRRMECECGQIVAKLIVRHANTFFVAEPSCKDRARHQQGHHVHRHAPSRT